MATFTVLPGNLNLSVKRGDTLSVGIDFSQSLAAYTVSSEIISTVDRSSVGTITTVVTDAAEGQVSVSMTASETQSYSAGSYSWQLTWQNGAEIRTAVEGILEIIQ